MVTLTNFSLQLPPYRLSQGELRDWTLGRHLASAKLEGQDEDQLQRYGKIFERYAIKAQLIGTRFFECPDISESANAAEGKIYGVDSSHPKGSLIGQRMRFFSEKAGRVFQDFYPASQAESFHIVHVTCTGYASPSAAQDLIAKKGWGEKVGVTHAYHMGCYASLPAIRIAEGLVAAQAARSAGPVAVDIVHTEMCGLHMNPADRTPEQIVVQSLFADGHIKYSATSADAPGLKVLAVKEAILPDSAADMSWVPEDWGIRMNLSREIPDKISGVISSFFIQLCRQAGLEAGDLQRDAMFAIHPGGPKIIEAVQKTLELSEAQVEYSKKVLVERGNMSSATLPHVWMEILKADLKKGTKVVSFAFGPGLTVFGSVFEIT